MIGLKCKTNKATTSHIERPANSSDGAFRVQLPGRAPMDITHVRQNVTGSGIRIEDRRRNGAYEPTTY